MNTADTTKIFIKRIILISILVGGFMALFIPVGVVSQSNDNLCSTFAKDNNQPCLKNIDKLKTNDSDGIAKFIINISSTLTFISGAVAVLVIVYAGFTMVTDGGSGTRYKNGLQMLQYAIVGLVVSIVAYSIVALIGNLSKGTLL